MAKIIVAGGGHGAIACAAVLAENGFDVTVYEQHKREDMGYDWTDIFDGRTLKPLGIPYPEKDKYTVKSDVIFCGPSENNYFVQRSPKNQPEIRMERKDIYNLLINFAVSKGVKFEFEHNIKSALLAGDRVTGIKTDKGEYYADLVLDGCGCESVIRKTLPDCLGIQKNLKENDLFYVYRAFYNRKAKDTVENRFKLTLFSNGHHGISWVTTEDDYTDVLIGRFKPFNKKEANEALAQIRAMNEALGAKKLRGGSFATIPIRQTLAIMVADGYAAIGDSAFMTTPLIGSGIANALKAAKILADVIIADETKTYSAETLWKYQRKYYQSVGMIITPFALLKNVVASMTPEQIDYVFDSGILEAKSKAAKIPHAKAAELSANALEILVRVRNLFSDKQLKKLIGNTITKIAKLSLLISSMPKEYSRNEVQKWAQKYNRMFD